VCLLISNDKDYARDREDKLMLERPKNFVEGFGYGCQTALSSLGSAVTGTIYRPYIETRRRGVSGLLVGGY